MCHLLRPAARVGCAAALSVGGSAPVVRAAGLVRARHAPAPRRSGAPHPLPSLRCGRGRSSAPGGRGLLHPLRPP